MPRRRDSDDVPEEIHTPDVPVVTSVPESTTPAVLVPDAAATIDATLAVASKPSVALRVFVAASGIKRDQLRGFESWASRQGLGPMTITDWHRAYKDHHNRPMK